MIDDPAIRGRDLLLYGALTGATSGLLEASFRAVHQLATDLPAAGFFWELFWMAPLSAGIAGLAVAAVLVALGATGTFRVGLATATLVLGFLAIYAVVQTDGLPLHPASEMIASLGLASVAARAAAGHAAAVERFLGRAPRYLLGALVLLAGFAVLRLPAVAERRALADSRGADPELPNVILIILDTVRAANLGLYGHDRPTSPRLSEWARSGVVYERAYSTAPWTLPSHATIFTGRYPHELDTGVERPFDGTAPTLAGVLADHGYATAGFVANLLYTTPVSGLHRGFARYQAQTISVGQLARSAWLPRMALRALGRDPRDRKDAARVTAEFFRWLDGRDERPFFAFLNYFDAHEPYESPDPFRTRFGPGPEEPWGTRLIPWHGGGGDEASRALIDQWVERYDGAIAYIDHQLGLIRDRLAAEDLLDGTIVVITADHGEAWGEHGLIGHMNALYVPLLHVPLVVSYPGGLGTVANIETPVSLRDVPATILELAGIGGEPPLPGIPLTAFLGEGRLGASSPVLAELEEPPHLPSPHAPVRAGDMQTAFEGNLHYIRNGDGSEELYDIAADPSEQDDLAQTASFEPTLERFRARLRAALRSPQR